MFLFSSCFPTLHQRSLRGEKLLCVWAPSQLANHRWPAVVFSAFVKSLISCSIWWIFFKVHVKKLTVTRHAYIRENASLKNWISLSIQSKSRFGENKKLVIPKASDGTKTERERIKTMTSWIPTSTPAVRGPLNKKRQGKKNVQSNQNRNMNAARARIRPFLISFRGTRNSLNYSKYFVCMRSVSLL